MPRVPVICLMMQIRLLTAADTETYAELRLESLTLEQEAFSSSVEQHRNLTVDDLKSRLGPNSENFVFGAFDGTRLVGTAGFFREKGAKTQHKGHVWGVYVAHPARGQGVGRSLMQAVLQRAAQIEGIEQVQLSVTDTQTAAGGLYRSLRFEPYGLERKALKVGGRYLDEEFMALFFNSRPAP